MKINCFNVNEIPFLRFFITYFYTKEKDSI